MTVTASETRRSYLGNGATVTFNYGYKFFTDEDLTVYLVLIANGTYTVPVLGTNYTVTGAGLDAGGSITFMVAPPNGYKVVIINDPEAIQDKNYVNADDFPAESHEEALDRLTKLVQRLQDRMERTAQIPDTSDDDPPDPADILQAAIDTAADRIATAADVVLTHADVVSTHADVVTVAANKAIVAADKATVAADKAIVIADMATVATDKGIVTADKATTLGYKNAADADVVLTHADVVLTHADVVLTHADVVLTHASAVQTALDRIAAAASASAAASSAASLVNVLTLVGSWDASAGTFPNTAGRKAGWTYIVTVAGTVNGVAFGADDKLIAQIDTASTTVYAGNWFKVEGGTIISAQITAALGFTPADQARTVSVSGLATGGGDLSANRTIGVPAAIGTDVTAGTSTTLAVTPKAMADAGVSVPIAEATDAEVWAGTVTTKMVTPRRNLSSKAWVALTDAATIAVDGATGRNFKLTSMAGNRTLGNMTNAAIGETYMFAIKQDATGSRTLAYGSSYTHDGDAAQALGTTANKWSVFSVTIYDATHFHVQLIAVNTSWG